MEEEGNMLSKQCPKILPEIVKYSKCFDYMYYFEIILLLVTPIWLPQEDVIILCAIIVFDRNISM